MTHPVQPWAIYLYIANACYLVSDMGDVAMCDDVQAIAIVLIVVGAVARSESLVATVSVVGGIIAVGVGLFGVAAFGLWATYRRKRGLIFIV